MPWHCPFMDRLARMQSCSTWIGRRCGPQCVSRDCHRRQAGGLSWWPTLRNVLQDGDDSCLLRRLGSCGLHCWFHIATALSKLRGCAASRVLVACGHSHLIARSITVSQRQHMASCSMALCVGGVCIQYRWVLIGKRPRDKAEGPSCWGLV
jgi:hypothetical protein